MIAAVLSCIFPPKAFAEDLYETRFKYMYDQQVTVLQDQVQIRFHWKKKPGNKPLFSEGEEFELGVSVDPKIFAQPYMGDDKKLWVENVSTNFPCGAGDVYNYSSPGLNAGEVYTNIVDGCKNLIKTKEQEDFVKSIVKPYAYAPVDSVANFVVVSMCPEQFVPDKEYYFKYNLKPIEVYEQYAQAIGAQTKCPNDPIDAIWSTPPDYTKRIKWGYFWIHAKVQPDTLYSNTNQSVSITDCPYLVGIPGNPFYQPYAANNTGSGVTLFNRGCTPSVNQPWGFSDPAKNNWKSVSGHSCRDCDGDGLYDSDFKYPMYGDLVGDCNDNCSTINACLNDNCPQNSGLYCSQQCGGAGCGKSQKCSDPTPTCKGECKPGELLLKKCETGYGGYEWSKCLDNCKSVVFSGCPTPVASATPDTTLVAWVPVDDTPITLPSAKECLPGSKESCGSCQEKTCSDQGYFGSCQKIGVCTPGQQPLVQTCNLTGTQQKTCLSTCQWSDWSPCSVATPTCQPGFQEACGNCGTRTCGSDGQWSSCNGEKECKFGEEKPTACNGGGEKTLTCSQECVWVDKTTCPVPACSPGQTKPCGNCGNFACGVNGQWESNCNNQGVCNPNTDGPKVTTCVSGIGTKTETCSATTCQWVENSANCQNLPEPCVWQDWQILDCQTTDGKVGQLRALCTTENKWLVDPCQEIQSGCVCSVNYGCCNGCQYLPSSQICKVKSEHQCSQPQEISWRQVHQYCSGSDENCTGQVNTGAWTVKNTCSAGQLCTPATPSYLCQ